VADRTGLRGRFDRGVILVLNCNKLIIVLRSCDPFTSRLRQWKGLGFWLVLVTNASIAERSWSLLAKLAPRRALRVSRPNQISIWLSQLAEVGVKWKCTLPSYWASQSAFVCVCSSCPESRESL
jgi:hypothetical protein